MISSCALSFLALSTDAKAHASDVPINRAGNVLLLGGGDAPPAVLRRFVELAGGADAVIVVLPMASGDEQAAASYYAQLFQAETQATQVEPVFINNREEAAQAAVVAAIRRANGVWFTGGDQSRITDRLLGTPAHEALLGVLSGGGVIGGTSAGTACQGTLMIDGSGQEKRIASDNLGLTNGLGIVEGVILDQHFAARQRQNRLLSAILEHPRFLGIGIDEQTAVWFRPDNTFQVIGNRVVFVYDARQAEPSTVSGNPTIRGMTTHILADGQSFRIDP
jgi:cyanophycinase